jgi:peptidoglycan/LPS O-acetylase OafA/YrhL
MTLRVEQEQVATPSRIAAIDGLRGLLAVVVLAWHVCSPFGFAWMLVCANVAVGLFFVLSGYVLTRGWNHRFGVFLVRRFVRLWPVYGLCLGAGYLIAGVHPVWTEFFWYPLIGPDDKPAIDPPIWSLFLEAWAMPFMPLVAWAGSSSLIRAALCIVALALASLAVPQIGFLGLFVAGAYLARNDLRNRILESAIPQWLGQVSYSLYLSHALTLGLAVRMFGPVGGVAAVPAAFAVAWLIWWGVERPSIWASRSLGHAAADVITAVQTSRRRNRISARPIA